MKLSEETKDKIRKHHLANPYIHTPEMRRKMSEASKGRVCWKKGLKGIRCKPETIQKIIQTKKERPYIYTEEVKRKISEVQKQQFANGERSVSSTTFKKGHKAWNKGLKGKGVCISWNKGRKLPDEAKERMRISAKKRVENGINIPPHPKGENHPCWLGGISFGEYRPDFNEAFKNKVRVRDGLICQKCTMFQEDNLRLFGAKLDIHHINYDKKLTLMENCISYVEDVTQNLTTIVRHGEYFIRRYYPKNMVINMMRMVRF